MQRMEKSDLYKSEHFYYFEWNQERFISAKSLINEF